MIGRALLVILLAALAWFAWQRPAPAPTPGPVRSHIPAPPIYVAPPKEDGEISNAEEAPEKQWYVVTHRLITPDAAISLDKQLREMGLEPIRIEGKESVTLHAFDNPDRFDTLTEARQVKKQWLENGIDAFVIEDEEGRYLVGLGRFYQIEHAEKMQDKLRKTARPYSYQRRTIPIPIIRFTFASGNKQQSEALWKKLEAAGIMMPVLMPEEQFKELYGDATEDEISETVE